MMSAGCSPGGLFEEGSTLRVLAIDGVAPSAWKGGVPPLSPPRISHSIGTFSNFSVVPAITLDDHVRIFLHIFSTRLGVFKFSRKAHTCEQHHTTHPHTHTPTRPRTHTPTHTKKHTRKHGYIRQPSRNHPHAHARIHTFTHYRHTHETTSTLPHTPRRHAHKAATDRGVSLRPVL